MSENKVYHVPVMLDEVLSDLNIKPDGVYLDGTCGGANHSFAIAERLVCGGQLYAMDQDPDAIAEATVRLAGMPATIVHANFTELGKVLAEHHTKADGILLDLGVSSHELDEGSRGFSYHQDAPLDMRMSQSGRTAADLVNTLTERELSDIIFRYGEEKFSRQIAAQIVAAREIKKIETTSELAELIKYSHNLTCSDHKKLVFFREFFKRRFVLITQWLFVLCQSTVKIHCYHFDFISIHEFLLYISSPNIS